MAKTKKTVLLSVFTALVLALVVFFGTSVSANSDSARGENMSTELLADEAVDIIVDKNSPYELVYSSDALQADSELAGDLRKLITAKSLRPAPDSKEETENEILIGMTNREESQTLLAYVNAKAEKEDAYVWAYAYMDGKLLFLGNAPEAYKLGRDAFLALVSEDGTLSVPGDLFVIDFMTVADYEQMLRDEEEAARQEKLKELIEKNKAFEDEPRLNEGYLSMIGDENAYFTESPYAQPWAFPAPNQHPRYLITEDNVKTILAMQDDPEYDVIFKNLWHWANYDIKEGVFPERTGGSGETNRYSESIITGISARAMAYLLTGDEVYAYEAIIAVKNAMLTLKYTTDIHMDVYHGASHVMVVLAAVYDWCYPVLTETDKAQLITGAATCLWPTMEFSYPPTNFNGISGHGTGPQFLRDYMSLAVAFYDEAPDWWEFVMGRYFQEYLPVANQQYVNGWISQGTACYAPIKLMVQLWAAYLIEVCTGENFFTEDASLSVQLFVSQLQPNGLYFQTGDGGRNPNGAAPGYAEYFVSAALFNDPIALAWAKHFTNDYRKYNTGSIFTMTPDFQLCFISEVAAKEEGIYDSIDLVQYFLDPAGQMTARNSWDEDGAAVFMKVGNMSMSNHDVYEHGTFQIYYKGLLAADSGSYKHYGGDSHYYYLQCTVAHNGLLIFNPAKAGDAVMNGNKVTNPGTYYYSGSQHRLPSPSSLEQWNDGTYHMAETTGADWGYNTDGSVNFAYIAGDITEAYDETTVEYVGRRMLTLYTGRADVPMIFVVFDEIVSDKDYFEKTFLLHTVKEPEVDYENFTATITSDAGGKMVLHSLYGADRIEKIGGEGYAYWINDYYLEDGTNVPGKNCLDEYTPDDNYMNIWGRVQLRSARTSAATNFLTAMYVTDTEINGTVDITKYQNDYVYGLTAEQKIVMFATGRDKAYKQFEFETEGVGLYEYYISGISDGTWQVTVDGVSVAYALASDDSGMIKFIAPTGKVTIIPGKDVIGANGGKIQYSTGGATLPEDAPYSYNNEVATPLPSIAYRGEDVFLGWYLTSECLPNDRVYEVPAGTEGTFRVYAKWLSTFVNDDYSVSQVAAFEGNQTVNGITYAGNGKPGASFKTKTDENDRKHLEWIEGSSDSFIHAQSSANNIATAVADDKSISITLELASVPDKPNLVSSFQLVAKHDVNGSSIASQHTHIFRTDASGNVLLGGSKKIATITAEPTTIRVVIDFEYGQFKAYDKDGAQIGATAFRPSAATGAATTAELQRCYKQYIFYWHGDSPADAPDSTMRIYKIKMQDGNIFEGGGGTVGNNSIVYKKNGGSLPAGVPYEYSTEEATVLPTNVIRDGYYFAGWYTTETFDEGTRTYYVPTDTKGPYTVYAKWKYLAVDENFDNSSINIGESTSGKAGSLSFNAGSAGELKPGSSFVTESDENGTYLKASVGSKNAIVYHASSSYNLTHFTDTAISYEFNLRKLAGVDFPGVLVQIATSGNSYGNLAIMTIDESGNAKLAGSNNVFATVGEGAYTTFRLVIDFAESTITAYDADGGILDIVKVTSVPSGTSGTPASLAEWQKVASNYLFYFMIYRTDKTEGAVSSVAIDDLKIAEGNACEREEVELPVGTGIIYKLYGGVLGENAPAEYDSELGTLLPTDVTKPGGVFGGWYTSEDYSEESRIHYIAPGTTGSVKVYAKWLAVIVDEDYIGSNFSVSGTTSGHDSLRYNANNSGMTLETAVDASGNTYLKASVEGTSNTVIFASNSGYNFTTFAETAVSYEFDLKKLEGIDLSRAGLSIQTSGGRGGAADLLTISADDGAIKLSGSTKVIGYVGEAEYTKLRVTVDFATGTIYAFDGGYNVIDAVAIKVPTGFGVSTALEWQKIAENYTFYFSISKQNTAMAVDNIKVIEGRAFEKPITEIPPRTAIEYNTFGGILGEGAPTEYDKENGTILPTDVVRDGYVFAGWYTTEDFANGTEIEYIPARTEGVVEIYAKWYTVLTDEKYTYSDINVDSGQPVANGVAYNALNEGVSYVTETDAAGNAYLRVNNAANGYNGVIRTTDSAYNISTFKEDAVSFELSLSKIPGVDVSTIRWLLQSSSSAQGTGELLIVTSDASGNVMLNGGSVSLGTISEDVFLKIRIGVDFAAGTVSAYDENNNVIDSVTPAAPAGFATLAEWQRGGLKHHILFFSFANPNSKDSEQRAAGLLVDDILVVDGMIFKKALDNIPVTNNVEYETNGGELPTDAPTEYDSETGLTLATPTKEGATFAGWYTTETFDEGTLITEIAPGTEGVVRVYAKWLTAAENL